MFSNEMFFIQRMEERKMKKILSQGRFRNDIGDCHPVDRCMIAVQYSELAIIGLL